MASIPDRSGRCCATAADFPVRRRSPRPVGPLRRCSTRSAADKAISQVNRPTKRKKEAELMTMTDQRLKTLVLRPQDYRLREPLDVLGEPGLVKLAGADTGNAVAMVHLTVPKLAGPPLHRHSREDEWFYVLDGELTWEGDGQRFKIGRASIRYVAL